MYLVLERCFKYLSVTLLSVQAGLSEAEQEQMRKMLNQKESNYNRLRRAKMDKSMFVKIKTLGIGAFGEVCLTRKVDTGALYAMKTLRKKDVLNRNQVIKCIFLHKVLSIIFVPVTKSLSPLFVMFVNQNKQTICMILLIITSCYAK